MESRIFVNTREKNFAYAKCKRRRPPAGGLLFAQCVKDCFDNAGSKTHPVYAAGRKAKPWAWAQVSAVLPAGATTVRPLTPSKALGSISVSLPANTA